MRGGRGNPFRKTPPASPQSGLPAPGPLVRRHPAPDPGTGPPAGPGELQGGALAAHGRRRPGPGGPSLGYPAGLALPAGLGGPRQSGPPVATITEYPGGPAHAPDRGSQYLGPDLGPSGPGARIIGNCRGGAAPRRQHERWLWPLADHVICNSAGLEAELTSHYGVPPARLTVIHNGVDPDYFQPPAAPGPPPDPAMVLSVARLVPDKDHADPDPGLSPGGRGSSRGGIVAGGGRPRRGGHPATGGSEFAAGTGCDFSPARRICARCFSRPACSS